MININNKYTSVQVKVQVFVGEVWLQVALGNVANGVWLHWADNLIFVKFCHSIPSITAGDRKRGREGKDKGGRGREGKDKGGRGEGEKEGEKEGGREEGGRENYSKFNRLLCRLTIYHFILGTTPTHDVRCSYTYNRTLSSTIFWSSYSDTTFLTNDCCNT